MKTKNPIHEESPTLTDEEHKELSKIGFQDENKRAGTFLISDQKVRYSHSHLKGVEIMPLHEALIHYPKVQDLMFGLISPDQNEYTKRIEKQIKQPIGSFIRVLKGNKVKLPLQTYTMLSSPQINQYIHNITVIEKNAELEIIGGATTEDHVHSGNHIEVSECYVHDGASLKSTSIEKWGSQVEVYSFSASKIGKNAKCVSTSILMSPVKIHYSEPRSYLGEGSLSRETSIIFAPSKSKIINAGVIYLQGIKSTAEIDTRTVSTGGHVTIKNAIIGESKGCKGFNRCYGLQLSKDGGIVTQPGLEAKTTGLQLSHEASVGMIDKEKLSYLMASGLNEDKARNLIIKGFLKIETLKIPEKIRKFVEDTISSAKSGGM